MKVTKRQLRRIIKEEHALINESAQIRPGDFAQMAQMLDDAVDGLHSGYKRRAFGEEPGQTSLYRYTEIISSVQKALAKEQEK
jgi:hypothetical protein